MLAYWHIYIGIAIVLLLAIAAYLDWQSLQIGLFGPRDTVGNGITIGLAKAFDNRSLALRIERLSNSLAQMKVVDQKATHNIGKLQGQSSTLTARSLTLDASAGTKAAVTSTTEKIAPTHPAADGAAKNTDGGGDKTKAEPQSEVALSAGDILNEQLNLASQIMNLQTLYERSLTDRLIDEQARLQTVLGFQVSITPPAGFQNCVAVVEVAVRLKPGDGETLSTDRVSLVAMIPQEKTYNAQTISTKSDSIGGSAVASIVTLGVSSKGESRQVFVHRDSDTVAFERNSNVEPRLFADDKATVFGWEFRPVLDRQTVSPGMRQMLAVVSLPRPDTSEYDEDVTLEIRTRSYWRRYNKQNQTTATNWHWYPRVIDGSGTVDGKVQELAIPNTARIQKGLAPKVATIKWVNSGENRATVIVKGENLFPGTKVLAGGNVYREEDATLTLKSDQALEFETTLTAIASGDAVLSGRFGRSSQLEVEEKIPFVKSLYITRAGIKQSRRGKDLRVSIDVKGINDAGDDIDLQVSDLEKLPEPILFVGNEPIPMPYDYWPLGPHEPEPTPQAQTGGTTPKGGEFSFAKPSTKKSIRVEAWIPSRIALPRNSSVMFRVPFCGLDYQASWPLQFFEPTVTRLGGDLVNSVFRISHSLYHKRAVSVELDRIYESAPELIKVSPDDGDYRFTVANNVLSQYRNLVLRIEGAEPYVVPIPEDKPKPKPVLDLDAKPPEISKGTIGPAEWSGTDLGLITAATLITMPVAPLTPGALLPAAPTRTPATFTVYDADKKIAVYFNPASTDVLGKASVEFQFGPIAIDMLYAPLLITNSQAAAV
ncbi:MAG TPA: hypothetical protein VGK82_18620 [Pyrinomonadaceae bacterium]